MFVRIKKNNSGTFTILLIASERRTGKNLPYPKVVKNFGTVTTEEEALKLKDIAQQYMVSISSAIEQNNSTKNVSLIIKSANDILSCTTEIIGFKNIYEGLFDSIFSNLDLKNIGKSTLKQLSIMRIIKPKSKRYTANIASNFSYNLKLDMIYKFMDRLDEKMIDKIKKISFQNTKNLLNNANLALDILFYDITTIYFEVNTQDDLRDFGFSKDGKHQHVQIVLAIIVTHDGLPISYEIFKGNTYEGGTLIPTILKLKQDYNIKRIILIADSGLINKNNIEAIKAAKLEYIIGARIKNSSKKVLEAVFSDDGYIRLNDDMKSKIYDLVDKNNKKTKDKLIIYSSLKRAKKDLYDRELALTKINKHVGSTATNKLSGVLKKSYVTLSQTSFIEIDEKKLQKAAKFDGIFAIQTNIKKCNSKEILDYYKGLYQVEQTFKISKYNLRIRPVFHYNLDRIKAHFAICYISLVLIRTLEFKMKQHNAYIPIEQLHELLSKVTAIKINDTNKEFCITTDFPKELKPLYKLLNINEPLRFVG